ncbi:MAG: 30S ribosomal protein S6e, partial [Candidatus Aenigmarchaeota archaeon]|nr:30S ribosomal protein S6e [Candidatus Aenigmarchaeota archaeon]
MASFKFVIGDPKTRKTYQIEIDQDKAVGIMGKKIGDKFNGDLIGLPGYEIKITGGTDKDGFPMHPRVHGMVRKKIVLSHPPGFHPKREGMRKRKMVAGNTISNNIVQINCKVIKEGSKKIPVLLGKEESKDEKKEEKPKKEEKKPEKKEEVKKEKKEETKEEKKEEKPKEKKKESKKEDKKQEKVEEG